MYARINHSYTQLIQCHVSGIVREPTVWGFISSQYPSIHDIGRTNTDFAHPSGGTIVGTAPVSGGKGTKPATSAVGPIKAPPTLHGGPMTAPITARKRLGRYGVNRNNQEPMAPALRQSQNVCSTIQVSPAHPHMHG